MSVSYLDGNKQNKPVAAVISRDKERRWRQKTGNPPFNVLRSAGLAGTIHGRGINSINDFLQRIVEFGIALRSFQIVAERAREAGDNTFIFRQAVAGFIKRITARQRYNLQCLLVIDQLAVKIRFFRQGQLENNLLAVGQGIEIFQDFGLEDFFSFSALSPALMFTSGSMIGMRP